MEEERIEFLLNLEEEVYDYQTSFREIIRFNDKEISKIKSIIFLFIAKWKERKAFIITRYNDNLTLANEFCYKVVPIMKMVILKCREKLLVCREDEIYLYTNILNKFTLLLDSINVDLINEYFLKANGDHYGRVIIMNKLNRIVNKDKVQLHALTLLTQSLLPMGNKPVRQQTVGVPGYEMGELMDE